MEAVGTRNLKLFVYEDAWKHEICEHREFRKDTNPNRSAKVEGNAYEIQSTTR